MSLYRHSTSSQVESIYSTHHSKLKSSGKIYQNRQDVQKIKSKLQSIVSCSDYWVTLSRFIHGGCPKQKFDEAMSMYLPNNDAKKLHNEFLRAILFNAHFASAPPPGIDLPPPRKVENASKKSAPQQKPRTDVTKFVSYASTDMGHLPSIEQLPLRAASVTRMKLEEKASVMIFIELKKYISLLLERCVQLRTRNHMSPVSMVITYNQVLHVINTTPELRAVISPSILTKFEMC